MMFLQGPNSDVTYYLTGNNRSLEYFMVNPTTGEVTLKKPIVDTNIQQFTVRICKKSTKT